MSEWKEYKLGDVANYVNRGVSPSYVEVGGVPILNQKCIRNGKLDFLFSKQTASEKKYTPEKQLKEGDILINSTGVGTAGRVTLFNYDFHCYVDTHVSIIRLNRNISHPKFVFYNLYGREDEIENYAEGSTGQIELGRDKIKDIDILLPPLPHQIAIASVLGSLDDKIDLLQRQNATLEKMAETLFRQWFVEEAKEEWENDTLSFFADFFNGKSRPSEVGEIPIYGGNGILGYANKSNYSGKSIIIGRVGAYCGSLFYENKDIWVSDNALLVKSKKINSTHFLFYLLKTLELNSLAEGSSHPLLTQTLLKSIKVKIPPIKKINYFDALVEDVHCKIDFNQNQIHTLIAFREILLPKLMNGEIKLTNLEI